MTSVQYVAALRERGACLRKLDGTLLPLPADFLQSAVAFCANVRCASVSYDIRLPGEDADRSLRVLECGFAEIVDDDDLDLF